MRIREYISLKALTTLNIGGTARYFVSVGSVENLRKAVLFAKKKKLPLVVLGGGSNVLVTDEELSALVVKIEIKGMEWRDDGRYSDSVIVIAGAGESWDGLVVEAVKRKLCGIENLSGIPGTVGAAPVQNIGAYGAELKNVLEWVEVVNPKGSTLRSERLDFSDCQLSYRDSVFKKLKGKSLIITRVALRLEKHGIPNLTYKDLKNYFEGKPQPTLGQIRRAVIHIRSKKFPDLKKFGTAGSFFKNPIVSKAQFERLRRKFPDLPGFPISLNAKHLTLNAVKVPLAWILDNICGLKGYRKGNLALFERQPIVLVNTGGASAAETKKFADEVIARVKAKTAIDVEWEVQRIS
ncbi:MAG: UDP-N-acetylmuramate dehydrogenase [Patescibacteria group bacterium]